MGRTVLNTTLTRTQNEEPQLGDFCAVRDDDHIYVYGRRSTDSNDIVLGRVPKRGALKKSLYQYWTESGWVPSGEGLAKEPPAIFTGAEKSSH
jgi:hypothetical protein